MARRNRTLCPERRLAAGLARSARSKPVTDRRSALSPIPSEGEICKLAARGELRRVEAAQVLPVALKLVGGLHAGEAVAFGAVTGKHFGNEPEFLEGPVVLGKIPKE